MPHLHRAPPCSSFLRLGKGSGPTLSVWKGLDGCTTSKSSLQKPKKTPLLHYQRRRVLITGTVKSLLLDARCSVLPSSCRPPALSEHKRRRLGTYRRVTPPSRQLSRGTAGPGRRREHGTQDGSFTVFGPQRYNRILHETLPMIIVENNFGNATLSLRASVNRTAIPPCPAGRSARRPNLPCGETGVVSLTVRHFDDVHAAWMTVAGNPLLCTALSPCDMSSAVLTVTLFPLLCTLFSALSYTGLA